MPKVIRFLIFIIISMALLADVVFIIWATNLNALVVAPALLSACYLAYLAAHYTISKSKTVNATGELSEK
jgi:membrane-bound acyltransferase YfiQ involved in biofilm formation